MSHLPLNLVFAGSGDYDGNTSYSTRILKGRVKRGPAKGRRVFHVTPWFKSALGDPEDGCVSVTLMPLGVCNANGRIYPKQFVLEGESFVDQRRISFNVGEEPK